MFYACDREDAAEINFDDQFIYDEIDKEISNREIDFVRMLREEAVKVFDKWDNKNNKTVY